jgi:TRAP transporter TAXI family solute receptor
MPFFRIGTGGVGGTYFPIGGIIANEISNPPGSRACKESGNCGVPGLVAIAQSTNASAQNVNAIQAGQMEAGLSGAATLHFACHGVGKYKGNAKPDLRIIANLYPEDLHLVMPKRAALKGLGDLKGKRIGIAQAGSGTQIAVELIVGDHGVNRNNISAAKLNNSQSAERLADEQLDAYFYAAGTPVAAMIQLDNTKGRKLYTFTDEEVTQANKTVPYYIPSKIPAGPYPSVPYDVNTVAVSGIMVANANIDEELEKKYDSALNTRDNGPVVSKLLYSAMICFAVYHLWTAGFGTLVDHVHMGIHLTGLFLFIFTGFPLIKSARALQWRGASPLAPGNVPFYDWALAGLAIAASLFLWFSWRGFVDNAMIMAGRYTGGPAKVSVVSSAFLGTISGCSIANTVSTGALTIPYMKKMGYPGHFVGGVEATASAGGQIITPIMGAASFLMAELYHHRDRGHRARIDSLHRCDVDCALHRQKKLNLPTYSKEGLPKIVQVWREGWFTIIPLVALLVLLLSGNSPNMAAFVGLILCVIVGFCAFDKPASLTIPLAFLGYIFWKASPYSGEGYSPGMAGVLAGLTILGTLHRNTRQSFGDLCDSFHVGVQYALAVGAASAAVGIVVGVINTTGVAFRLGFMVTGGAADIAADVAPLVEWSNIDAFSQPALQRFISPVLIAMACIVMGAGLPTTALYIMLVAVATPALSQLGVPPLATAVSGYFLAPLSGA